MPNVSQDYLRQFAQILAKQQNNPSIMNMPDWTTVANPNLNPQTGQMWSAQPSSYNQYLAGGGRPMAQPTVSISGKPIRDPGNMNGATGWASGGWLPTSGVAKAVGGSTPLNTGQRNRIVPPEDSPPTYYNETGGIFTPASDYTNDPIYTFDEESGQYIKSYPGGTGDTVSYWQDPPTGLWYKGEQGGAVTPIPGPPWESQTQTDTGYTSGNPFSQTPGAHTGTTTQANPFINTSGGFDYGSVPGTFNYVLQQLANREQPGVNTQLGGYLGDPGNYPNAQLDQARGALTSSGNLSGGLQQAGYNAITPSTDPNDLSHPGGLQSLDQRRIMAQLMQLIQGSGLTPEYVQAMRQSVLDPSTEALAGRLNQMGGGVAAPSSGLFQELQRRNERDFNNQLIGRGFENLQGFIGQGLGGAATGMTQGLQAYGLGQQGALQGAAQQQQMVQQFLQAMQQYLSGQQQFGLGQNQQVNDFLRTLASLFGTQMTTQSAADIARSGSQGAALSQLATIIPAIIGGFNQSRTPTISVGTGGTNTGQFGTPPFVGPTGGMY